MEKQEELFSQSQSLIQQFQEEISTFIVGQEKAKKQVLWSLLAGGHALLEGLPGVGKTMLVKAMADVMSLSFSRIQFTPDLMPSDITGTMILNQKSQDSLFTFHKGPIFSQIVLADEINRATPKTQSALLEAMAENTVTIMGESKLLPKPFFVLATQNPVDLEGTYPLPEAQMDRFLCKIDMEYPNKEQLKEIIKRTVQREDIALNSRLQEEDLLQMQKLCREILVADEIMEFAILLISSTQPQSEDASEQIKSYVRYGAGPRGLQSLIRLAKARAFTEGRYHVSIGDVKEVALPVLRHRLFLTFEAEAEGITTDIILHNLLKDVNKVSLT
ncbi:putative ATPase [Bacillus sp. TS-2]|nr:putative ATPase [Bacillus sp. TS-2]